jgi:hypothetical protein
MKFVKVIFVAIFISFVLINIAIFYFWPKKNLTCSSEQLVEAAPINSLEFKHELLQILNIIKVKNNVNFDIILCTSVNAAAAEYNLPPFLKSISINAPNLINALIVFCVDKKACLACKVFDIQCIYLDLGISGLSLAPGGSDKLDRDYWRLTFGRVYATLKINEFGFSVLPVDVDSVFLQNPFMKGNLIVDRMQDIAVVSDAKPFSFEIKDKSVLNGGFLYFPSNKLSNGISNEALNLIWKESCMPKKNEQIVTSKVLRSLVKKHSKANNYYSLHSYLFPNREKKIIVNNNLMTRKSFNPYVLTKSKYLNFCNTKCSTKNNEFESILTINDLHALQNNNSKYSKTFADSCGFNTIKNWVFFHAACIKWPNDTKQNVAKAKGFVQYTILKWVKNIDI